MQDSQQKIHLAVDSDGLPIEFTITGGEVHDSTAAEAIMADKGYDSEKIRDQIKEKGARVVIPRKANSLIGNDGMDWALYQYRHWVENALARLKQFRAIATRYDTLKVTFQSMMAMACAFLWLPM